ncbi:hypothetical protein [Sulfurihydrogenibium azorense]|uniref:hypothetical protein n=1 Tax=Sulfurihydrogenibium azorense TaxID=309806 RepID=UPI00391A54CA
MRVVGSLATKFAPPFSLILHYFVPASLLQLLFPIFLFINKKNILLDFSILENGALTHLYLLGFIMMVIFGALYQLIPVALEIPVFSFKLGYLQAYLYILGSLSFIISMFFHSLFLFLSFFAGILFSSFFVFAFNFFMSLKNIEKFDITSIFIITGTVFLIFGTFFGLLIALSFSFGTGLDINKLLFIHAVMVVFGFVFSIIFGVGLVLLPMFSVSHNFNNIYSKVSYFLLTLGVFGFSISKIFSPFFSALFFIVITISIFIYLIQVYEIYKHKPKKKSDFALNGMFLSFLFIPTGFFGLFHSIQLFAVILFLGFLGLLVYSSLYKIVPFLTWFHRFSSLVGKVSVPTLSQMLPKNLPSIHLIIHSFSVIVISLGIILKQDFVISLGTFLLFVGSILFLYNFIYIVSYRIKE